MGRQYTILLSMLAGYDATTYCDDSSRFVRQHHARTGRFHLFALCLRRSEPRDNRWEDCDSSTPYSVLCRFVRQCRKRRMYSSVRDENPPWVNLSKSIAPARAQRERRRCGPRLSSSGSRPHHD